MSIKNFRATLDAWRDGRATIDEVEAALLSLSGDPELMGAARGLIDAYRNAGFLSAALADRLCRGEPYPTADIANRTLLRPSRSGEARTLFRPGAEPAEGPQFTLPRAGHTGPAGAGTLLSAQYVLEHVLPRGERGALGVVYRARDLIQEEAQDRNPYVAIKILSDWIGRDPEAIKSLNRQYKKTLALSHPNIVKVQNFGRDGDCVYLVTELLAGQSLDVLIAAASVGLPVSEALRIAQALARGLGYAHHMHLIHSDFKPSNCFITEDATIKIMDFGLARAVNTPVGGDLPYASYEQIRGAPPDARDDVYALGVVCYELLTGRHPFARRNALEAHDQGLKPRPVPGLSRRQWATLQSAMSFAREKRPRDAGAFLGGLTPAKRPMKFFAASAAAAALVLLACAYLTSNFLERRRASTLTEELASGNTSAAADAVQRLMQEDVVTRATVLSGPGAASVVLSVFENRARAAFDPALQRYDFPGAIRALAPARLLLTDSASLARFEQSLNTEQQRQLASDVAQFERLLAARALLTLHAAPGAADPGASDPSVFSVLRRIAALDPAHGLLRDVRVPAAFRDAAAAALSRSDAGRAGELTEAGLMLAPADPGLLELQSKVVAAR